ncbi:MAG: hypothetical protein RJA76_869, partial [Bacteroidota bacterium]
FVYKNSKFEVGMPHHSVQVAQYMNLYLNQSPKEIYQKIDTTNLNQILLQKANGEKIVLHEFRDTLYLKDW